MRYRVNGIEIRSENAAKPLCQRSAYLSHWIRSHPHVGAVLDYGCGKLRYAPLLAQRARMLTLVDSEIQIGRVQMIDGELTTVSDYARNHWPHSQTLTPEEFQRHRRKYDLVLCVNVLSAIPTPKTRSETLRLIASRLKPTGRCLFVTQYRNSYFRKAAPSKKAIKHLNGWILRSHSGNSYYGVLSKPELETLVKRHRFSVIKSWMHGESAYVLAGSGTRRGVGSHPHCATMIFKATCSQLRAYREVPLGTTPISRFRGRHSQSTSPRRARPAEGRESGKPRFPREKAESGGGARGGDHALS